MRHRKANQKLSLPTDQRLALLRGQVAALIRHGRIQTTLHRARATARLAERCIELGKTAKLASRRQIFALVQDRDLVKKVCTELSPRFQNQAGGYTRVIKVDRRMGDGASMAWLLLKAEAPA